MPVLKRHGVKTVAVCNMSYRSHASLQSIPQIINPNVTQWVFCIIRLNHKLMRKTFDITHCTFSSVRWSFSVWSALECWKAFSTKNSSSSGFWDSSMKSSAPLCTFDSASWGPQMVWSWYAGVVETSWALVLSWRTCSSTWKSSLNDLCLSCYSSSVWWVVGGEVWSDQTRCWRPAG